MIHGLQRLAGDPKRRDGHHTSFDYPARRHDDVADARHGIFHRCDGCDTAGARVHLFRVYENLLLVVDGTGKLSGYCDEEQGQDVVECCRFLPAGRRSGEGAKITTWETVTFAGTLEAGHDAIKLVAVNADRPPGCGLVSLPEITTEGVEYSLTPGRPWIGLGVVTIAMTVFHGTSAERNSVPASSRTMCSSHSPSRLHEGNAATRWIAAADNTLPAPP